MEGGSGGEVRRSQPNWQNSRWPVSSLGVEEGRYSRFVVAQHRIESDESEVAVGLAPLSAAAAGRIRRVELRLLGLSEQPRFEVRLGDLRRRLRHAPLEHLDRALPDAVVKVVPQGDDQLGGLY